MRTRILLDATPLRSDSGFGGIGRFIHDLLCGLEALRDEWKGELEISALVGLEGYRRWAITQDLRAAAAETIAARGSDSTYGLARRRRTWLGVAARDAKADLLHQMEPLGTPVYSRIKRLVTCYDLIPLVFPEEYLGRGPLGLVRRGVRFSRDWIRYRTADRLVAISERSKRDVVRIVGADPRRVDVVLIGIDLSRFQASTSVERDADLIRSVGSQNRPFVLYTGAGDYRKNVVGACAAVAHARRSVDIDFLWAGRVHPNERKAVEAAAARCGIEGHLHFLGFVPDDALAALYRAAVAHVFLSRLEGFGITVVEAMATGCPVVLANHSGADELAGDAACAVDADDAVGAGTAIVKLATNRDFREQKVRLGRERALRFDRVQMARDYLESYGRVLAER